MTTTVAVPAGAQARQQGAGSTSVVLWAHEEEGIGWDGGVHGQAVAMVMLRTPSRGCIGRRAWQDSDRGRPGEEAHRGEGETAAGGDPGPARGG